jgi:multidrug efflux pump subunit AcrB
MRRVIVPLVLLAALAAGCRRQAPTAADGPVIQVSLTCPGATAAKVADTIAAPIEEQLNGVEGSVRIESESRDDGSYVAVVRFDARTEPQAALTRVQDRVELAKPILPDAARRDGVSVKGVTLPDERRRTVRLALTDRAERGELRAWADAVMKRLAAEKVIDNPVTFPGPDEPRLEADVDARRCTAAGVAVADVEEVLRAAGKSPDVRELRTATVRSSKGRPVPLSSVATLRVVVARPAVYRVDLYRAIRITGSPPEGTSLGDAAARCVKIADEERERLKGAGDYAVVNLTDE